MHFEENLSVAFDGLLLHKARSLLTMLGIIFGVAAVIAMLSIGEGAKREAIEKFKDLGVNNIIIRERDLSDQELQEVRAKFSQGLSIADADAIKMIERESHISGLTDKVSRFLKNELEEVSVSDADELIEEERSSLPAKEDNVSEETYRKVDALLDEDVDEA